MKNRGFTLLEVIIYIGLFSVLMSGSVVATYQLLEGGQRNQDAVAIQQEGTFLNRKINWELSQATAVSVSGGNEITIDPGTVVIKGEADEITISRGGAPSVPLSSGAFAVEDVAFAITSLPGDPPAVSVAYCD